MSLCWNMLACFPLKLVLDEHISWAFFFPFPGGGQFSAAVKNYLEVNTSRIKEIWEVVCMQDNY